MKFHCDNESVVSIINTKRSKIRKMMDLLRHLKGNGNKMFYRLI